MKKISILMLVLVCLFGCQIKQKDVLEEFRSEASDLVVCQVAFIGFSDSEIPDLNALAQEYQIYEYFPFVESYPSNCYLDNTGYEIYLIVAQEFSIFIYNHTFVSITSHTPFNSYTSNPAGAK